MSGHGGHPVFDRVVLVAIAVNTVVLVWGWFDDRHEVVLEHFHMALLAVFVVEVAWRLHLSRLAFFKSAWSCADLVIIVVSVLPILGLDASVLRAARLARVVHLGRHLHGAVLARLWATTRRRRAVAT